MKKTLSLLLVLCCLLALVACGDRGSTPSTASANQIVYGERYIFTGHTNRPESEQSYYVPYKDRLEYHHYSFSSSSSTVSHYTVIYKYEVMAEGTLAYFFDSAEAHEDDSNGMHGSSITANGLLLFSKNVLSTPAGDIYIRESYLKNNLTNFGKDPS